MNKDMDNTGFAGRLWAGRGRDPKGAEKVLPLKAQPEARPPVRPAAPHDRSYVAFEVRDRADRLHIVRGAGPSRFPGYHYLLDISFDHHLQSAFTLIYSFMIVEVTGSNLEPVVHAISFGNCERIREYHPKLHDRPGQHEPVIEKIQITAADEKE